MKDLNKVISGMIESLKNNGNLFTDLIQIAENALEEIDKGKQETKKPGEPFCPEEWEEAWYINISTGAQLSRNWYDDAYRNIIKNGLVFPTRGQAEKKFQRIKAMLHLERLAEDLNEGWEPDWRNRGQIKWIIELNNYPDIKNKLQVMCVEFSNNGMPVFKKENFAKIAASKLSDDEIKAIFNVKEFTR